jgi:lipopolysaccharide export system protein LptC
MALVAGALLSSLLSACSPGPRTEQSAVAPELKLERVRFRVWRGDVLQARGEARQVTLQRDSGQLGADDVRVELPSRGEAVVVTAPRAQGLLGSQRYTVDGGVEVTHGEERAVTARAAWAPGPRGDGPVTGQDPVTVERGDLRLEGVGFTFDPRSGELEIGGPVRTQARGGGR